MSADGARTIAIEYMRVVDVIRVLNSVHIEPSLSLIEYCYDLRRRYEEARVPVGAPVIEIRPSFYCWAA